MMSWNFGAWTTVRARAFWMYWIRFIYFILFYCEIVLEVQKNTT